MNPEEFSFKDREQDIEGCCVETRETMMGTPYIGLPDMDGVKLFNAYMENQQYQAVVDYLPKQNWEWGPSKNFDHASEIFVEGREIYYIKHLWYGVLTAQEQNSWATKAVRGNNKSVERASRKSKQIGKSPPPVEEIKCELKGISWDPEVLPTRYPINWDYYHEQR